MKHFLIATLSLALCITVNSLPTAISRASQESIRSPSTLQWTSCGDDSPPGLDCAKLEVPLDWSCPDGEKITLSMSRLKANDTYARIGSLIFNPGGPGGAATVFCARQAAGLSVYFSKNLTSHFDIICPDPRGVGESNPIKCDPDIWNERQSLFPKNESMFQQLVDHNKAFGESCLDLTGDIVKYVDTVSAVKDFEALRVALNDGKLNLLGESYGSQIGQTYAELYPENIRAMAIDGILDHTAAQTYFHVTESETYETVLDRFFVWCNETESCALHGQNVSGIYDDLVIKADNQPIPAPGCLGDSNSSYAGSCYPNVTGEDIRFNSQGFLIYKTAPKGRTSGWQSLGKALSDASKGNATMLSSPMATDQNSTIWQGLAVGCLDWLHTDTTFAQNKYRQQLTGSTSPHTKGAAQSYTYETQCIGWPVPITNPQKPLNQTALSIAPPILLVNAYYDPSTSYTWASSVLEQVPTGVLLTRDGDGHTSYGLAGEAAAAIDAFLVNGTLPAPNTVVNT